MKPIASATPLSDSLSEPMIQVMSNPKTDKLLRLLVAIERHPQSSHELAGVLGISRPTVVRLVESLRDLGCGIEAVREGQSDWAYHLRDWGVFAPARVRRHVKDLGQVAPTGSAP